MALNLAVLSNHCVLLDLDKGPDLGIVANPAPVQIDEIGNLDVQTEPDVRRDSPKLHS
jgi:hypothetical protein